ncbi:MAG: hypothetical protein P8163_10215 [Candidatus Thiodiazotropha sp.]
MSRSKRRDWGSWWSIYKVAWMERSGIRVHALRFAFRLILATAGYGGLP